MADGILCKHCGWQETSHGHAPAPEKEANELRPRRELTLVQCLTKKGFTPENPKLARKLAKIAEDEAARSSTLARDDD